MELELKFRANKDMGSDQNNDDTWNRLRIQVCNIDPDEIQINDTEGEAKRANDRYTALRGLCEELLSGFVEPEVVEMQGENTGQCIPLESVMDHDISPIVDRLNYLLSDSPSTGTRCDFKGCTKTTTMSEQEALENGWAMIADWLVCPLCSKAIDANLAKMGGGERRG